MIVTVFCSRVRPESKREYGQLARRMSALVKEIPGYILHKAFLAEDGERVTIVEFESPEALRAWATHPEHVEAKKRGRRDFYAEYRVQVCEMRRESVFPSK